jgi:hypothetical protein
MRAGPSAFDASRRQWVDRPGLPNRLPPMRAFGGRFRWTLLALLALSGCYSQARPDARVARLRVIAEPEQAAVYIDDRFAGAAKVLAVRPHTLAPGRHFMTLQAPDHFPHDVMLDLPVGETTVRVSLRPVPP